MGPLVGLLLLARIRKQISSKDVLLRFWGVVGGFVHKQRCRASCSAVCTYQSLHTTGSSTPSQLIRFLRGNSQIEQKRCECRWGCVPCRRRDLKTMPFLWKCPCPHEPGYG